MSECLDYVLTLLPKGWRFHVGHTPHYYQTNDIPKFLRKRPFEAYVCNGDKIGTKTYVFESADGATASEALNSAIKLAVAKAATAEPGSRVTNGERK